MRFVRSSAVVWRATDHVLVAASIATGESWQIDGSAALVWRALDRPRSLEDITRHVSSDLIDPDPAIAQDIERLIGELVATGLVEERP